MGKRNDQNIPTRPSADEYKKILKLVALKNERGEKPTTWHEYTPSRVMIDAAIAEFEREQRTEYTKAEQNCKGCMGPCGQCESETT